jgi:uncharacterized OB-fold protein
MSLLEVEMKVNNSVCPCCGTKIVPYQEACLNCLIYLWEVV